jgi:hypothetical protein
MPFLGLGRGGDVVVGRPVSETQGETSGESEAFRDPLSETSDEAGRCADLPTCLAGGPARENVARLSLVDFFP